MTILAVSSGAARRRRRERTPGRVRALLEHLATLDAVDLVVVHDAGSAEADRRRSCDEIVPPERVHRLLEVAAPPLKRSGLLREVHIHRSSDAADASRRSPAAEAMDAFVGDSSEVPVLAWGSDVSALARATQVLPTVPTAVDVDHGVDLSTVRARRAVRSWSAGADLVTVGDLELRERLAVPGAVVVAAADRASFCSSITRVIDDARAYPMARRR